MITENNKAEPAEISFVSCEFFIEHFVLDLVHLVILGSVFQGVLRSVACCKVRSHNIQLMAALCYLQVNNYVQLFVFAF